MSDKYSMKRLYDYMATVRSHDPYLLEDKHRINLQVLRALGYTELNYDAVFMAVKIDRDYRRVLEKNPQWKVWETRSKETTAKSNIASKSSELPREGINPHKSTENALQGVSGTKYDPLKARAAFSNGLYGHTASHDEEMIKVTQELFNQN